MENKSFVIIVFSLGGNTVLTHARKELFMLKSFKLALVSLFMALFVVACSGSGPKDAAKTYMDGLVAGDSAKVMSVINYDTTSGVKTEAVKGKVAALIKEFSLRADKHGGFSKYELSDEIIMEDQATLKVKLSFKDGSTEVNDLTFQKVNDKWFLKF